MKVSTDACVFGGLMVSGLKKETRPQRGLDIGTGTGLLSMMLLQELPMLYMDAVEIDPDAFEQASSNFQQGPWPGRVCAYHSSIQAFAGHASVRYDLIVCNPPFFTDHLLTSEPQRRLARHTTDLTHRELLDAIKRLLIPGGWAGLLYPTSEERRVDEVVGASGLVCCKKIKIYPSHTKTYNRLVYILSDEQRTWDGPDFFYLRDDVNDYSRAYKELLSDFLLEKNNFLEKKISIN